MTIQNLLSRLQKVRKRGNNQWMACCPAHQDKTPSLSIKDDNGTILMRCFGQGCSVVDIAAAVGMDLSELFPPTDNYDYTKHNPDKERYHDASNVLFALILEIVSVEMICKELAKTHDIDEFTQARLHLASERMRSALAYATR